MRNISIIKILFMNPKNLVKSHKKGFTLIEILIVIGLIAILATVVLVALNPARQFAQARNSQRISNVNTILNAIGQNIADNKGVFSCSGSPYTIAPSPTDMKSGAANADLAPCLVPIYISSIPIEPIASTSPVCTPSSVAPYETCYSVSRDTITGRVTVSAPNAELGQSIFVTR